MATTATRSCESVSAMLTAPTVPSEMPATAGANMISFHSLSSGIVSMAAIEQQNPPSAMSRPKVTGGLGTLKPHAPTITEETRASAAAWVCRSPR